MSEPAAPRHPDARVARLVDQGDFSAVDLAEDSDLQGARGGAWLAGVLRRLREEALRRKEAECGALVARVEEERGKTGEAQKKV